LGISYTFPFSKSLEKAYQKGLKDAKM